MIVHLAYYLSGFILVWVGSGLAVKDIDKLSRRLHFTSFAVSFLFLGFFTSLAETSVGLNAVIKKDPEIFVGNLIGGSIVLFLLIIPLLAIIGNGLKMVHSLQRRHLALVLLTIAAPVFLIFDHSISLPDGVIFIFLYLYLFKTLHEERGVRNFLQSLLAFREIYMLRILVNIIFGIILILLASRIIVDQTIYFSQILGVSPYILSLLLISVGTNIPEISIAVRSLILKKREIALGDYLGSAAFNTFLMGVLTIFNKESVTMNTSFVLPLLFLVVGLGLFYFFGTSRSLISRKEGAVLLGLYLVFLVIEISKASTY